MQYGLIGKKLGHSFSKEVHAALADYEYELLELPDEEAVGKFLTEKKFRAINVTIPYKQTVIPFLAEISPEAKAIGAVNTIINRDGKLYGYNTDFYGMTAALARIGFTDARGRHLLNGKRRASRVGSRRGIYRQPHTERGRDLLQRSDDETSRNGYSHQYHSRRHVPERKRTSHRPFLFPASFLRF